MNKLVSKNPVQRFKEGRKIIKAQNGNEIPQIRTYGGIPLDSINNDETGTYTVNGIKYSVPLSQVEGNKKEYQFKGVNVGGKVLARNKNFGDRLTNENKEKLLSSGFFKDSDFSTVQSFQNALNRYFNYDGFGRIKADNMWGDQTQKAFEEALQKINAPVVNTIEGMKFQNGITPEAIVKKDIVDWDLEKNYKIPTTPPNIEIPKNAPTFYNFNRSQTRDWLRENAGGSAYAFTGEQRAAVRRILGGQGTDEDKALIQNDSTLAKALASYLKKGGSMLPSRDIVKRFKLQRIGK